MDAAVRVRFKNGCYRAHRLKGWLYSCQLATTVLRAERLGNGFVR